MTSDDTTVPNYSQDVEDELARLAKTAKGPPLFIIRVDANGDGEVIAAPGRQFQKIPADKIIPAVATKKLTCATWQIYEQNPDRGRGCIGADCYDGG